MFSSAKFLSPRVTVGFPAPGPVDAAVVAALLAVVLLLDFELLPHATSTVPASTTASTASARARTLLDLIDLLPSIRRLLVAHFVNRKTKPWPPRWPARSCRRRASRPSRAARAGSARAAPASERPRPRARPAPRRSPLPARPRSGSWSRWR